MNQLSKDPLEITIAKLRSMKGLLQLALLQAGDLELRENDIAVKIEDCLLSCSRMVERSLQKTLRDSEDFGYDLKLETEIEMDDGRRCFTAYAWFECFGDQLIVREVWSESGVSEDQVKEFLHDQLVESARARARDEREVEAGRAKYVDDILGTGLGDELAPG